MKYIHFSAVPLVAVRDSAQEPRMGWKPDGLWFSVEGRGSHGWKKWCEDEGFAADRFVYGNELCFYPNANILKLSTAVEILEFSKQYKSTPEYARHYPPEIQPRPDETLAIDWPRVATEYDGIIIAPYCWDLRLSRSAQWYYSWDCASGAVWRKRAVAEIICHQLPQKKQKAA